MPRNFHCKINLKPLQAWDLPCNDKYEQDAQESTSAEYEKRWLCRVSFGCTENNARFSFKENGKHDGEFTVELRDPRYTVVSVLIMWGPRPVGWRNIRDVGVNNLCGKAVLSRQLDLNALRPIGRKSRGDFGCVMEFGTCSGYFGIKRDRRSVLIRGGWDCQSVLRDLAILDRQGSKEKACRDGVTLHVHMMVVSACLGEIFNLAEGCFLERRLHSTRYREICAVLWRCDELTNHVQLNSDFNVGTAIALAHELQDASIVDEVWASNPCGGVMKLNIGVTRFGEVSLRVSFSPAILYTVKEEAWVMDVCRVYTRLLSQVASGCG